MPTLTTLDGTQFDFDPGTLIAIADHAADTGAAMTSVYGLATGWLEVSESPEALLQRLGLQGAFARLTRPDGSAVWLNGKAVTVIRPSTENDDPAAHAVVTAGVLNQAVRETSAEVKKAVDDHGGSL